MLYSRLYNSSDKKEIGQFPQIKMAIGDFDINSNTYIGNETYYLKEINYSPNLPTLILDKNSKLTDLISVSFIGLSEGLIISNKLKCIIKNIGSNFQLFPIKINQGDILHCDYYYLRISNISYNYIDFNETKFLECENLYGPGHQILINNAHDFNTKFKNLKYPKTIKIENLSILPTTKESLLALNFVEGGIGFYISEELKSKIKESKCTGIVFTELNQKYP